MQKQSKIWPGVQYPLNKEIQKQFRYAEGDSKTMNHDVGSIILDHVYDSLL